MAKVTFNKRRAFGKLCAGLGIEGLAFLENALGAILTLLPHVVVTRWQVRKGNEKTRVSWDGPARQALNLRLHLKIGDESFHLVSQASRSRAQYGLGAGPTTMEDREFDLCRQILERTEAVLKGDCSSHQSKSSLNAIKGLFVEHVVAAHLKKHLEIEFDVAQLFVALRELAEQSYENKSITYGLLISSGPVKKPDEIRKLFPIDFFEKKRYRALSDGYRTAFAIDRKGTLLGLRDLQENDDDTIGRHYYPEWCRFLAASSSGDNCGISLTRQGDILVFDGGSLRFSYRAGRWQYWNHSHAIKIFRSRMHVQHVDDTIVTKVVNRIYRVALDVSFRRSGCLFVLLRNKKNIERLVVSGDGIGDPQRDPLFSSFDETLGDPNVRTLTVPVLVELSALDGAVIVDNQGSIMAYGAVLKTSGRSSASEGSRTKAALSASKFGVSVKVSSDGDINFYQNRASFFSL